jgi:zinc-ribbon domain
MSGLFRRIRPTRAAAAEESRIDPPAPSEPQDASTTAPGGHSLLADPAALPPEPPTDVQPAPEQPLAAMHDLPAGLEVEELSSPRPATEGRSRLRRRTRYLRRVRELLLRDLGGLVYEISRAPSGETRHHQELVHAKTQRLAALDGELYALEDVLGATHPETVLREPGIGGVCPTCGELHSSDARFCSACGSPLTGHAAAVPHGEEPADAPTVMEPSEADRTAETERPTEVAPSAESDQPGEVDRTAETERPTEVAPSAESDQPAEVSGSDAERESPPVNGRGADAKTNGSETAGAEWAWPVERPR